MGGMGTFLTYRIAGGEAGMRHFMAQFGPALQWPWTKLMDVPELTDELLDKLAAQSDAQAAGARCASWSASRRVPRGVLQALRARVYGAGEVLADTSAPWWRGRAGGRTRRAGHRRIAIVLRDAGAARVGGLQRPRPREPVHAHVRRCDRCPAGAGRDRRGVPDRAGSYFTVETHISPPAAGARATARGGHPRARLGRKAAAPVPRAARAGDGEPVATAEQMLLHVSAETGRAGPAGADVRERVTQLADEHAALLRPDRAGRSVGER